MRWAILALVGVLLLAGCKSGFDKYQDCIDEKYEDCFEEGNCHVGTTPDELKIQCCFENGGFPIPCKADEYCGCGELS